LKSQPPQSVSSGSPSSPVAVTAESGVALVDSNSGPGAASSTSALAPTRIILADLRLTPEAEQFMLEANSKADLQNDGGARVVFAKTNVTIRADLENLVQVSLRTWGDVPDVWVAGAGIFEPVSLNEK
jgi:hypothetical protein